MPSAPSAAILASRPMLLPLLLAAVAGYFLGALPFGYLVARRFGLNIFEHGSKNPGATNVKRVLGEKFGAKGKRAGNLVFFLDALKGAVATGWPLLVQQVVLQRVQVRGTISIQEGHDLAVWSFLAVVGLAAALLGHSFSCFTRFRGGKGVATSVGGVIVLAPLVIVIAAAVWAATFYTTRYVSLASMFAGVALPIAAFFLGHPPLLLGLFTAIALFVILRHRTNLARLLNGTETRFAKKPTSAA